MSESWGWATWKNRWDHFNPDAKELLTKLHEKKLIKKFNAYGSYDMIGMLNDQIEGRVSSWAIRWQAVCVLNNWLTLYPNPSFSNHIESKDATHANKNITPPLCNILPVLTTVPVEEIPLVIEAMKKGYSNTGDYFGNFNKQGLKKRIKNLLFFYKKNEK
jgi:hypothetical protein